MSVGGVGRGGVPRVREMGEARRACWDSLPSNHLWMVRLLLHTWFGRLECAFNVCAFENVHFYTFCFIVMIGSDSDSFSQNQPCTAGFVLIFCTRAVLFIKLT